MKTTPTKTQTSRQLQLSPEKRAEFLVHLTVGIMASRSWSRSGWAENIPDTVHLADAALEEIEETVMSYYPEEEAL